MTQKSCCTLCGYVYDSALGDLPHRVCYAVKANSSLGVLGLLAKRGAGFDIVSGGELFRVLKAGGDPAKIVFSGVGKTAGEIDAALEAVQKGYGLLRGTRGAETFAARWTAGARARSGRLVPSPPRRPPEAVAGQNS